jgi:hypothetical protein
MSFLFRLTLLLVLICILLPASNTNPSEEAQIDGKQAMTLARAAVSDARGFCERQPDACTAGGKVAAALLHKIEAGARALYAFVSDFFATQPSQKSAEATAPSKKATIPSATDEEPFVARQHGTLIPSDISPSWHGSVPLRPSGELTREKSSN